MAKDQIEGAIKNGVGRLQDGAGGLVGDPGLQAKGKLNQAAGFVQDLVGQAKDNMSDVIDKAKDRSSDSVERVQNGADQIQQRVRDTLAQSDVQFSDVKKLVAENPLAAVGIAAAVGVVAGLLLRRPSN